MEKSLDTKSKINVAIVDSQQIYRIGLKDALLSFQDISLVAESGTIQSLFGLLRSKIEVDVLLLDSQLPKSENVAAILKHVKEIRPKIKIICMIYTCIPHPDILEMMHTANSCIDKAWDEGIIHGVICEVMKSDFHSSPIIEEAIMADLKSPGQPPDMTANVLDQKEIEIIRMICDEKSTKEIAASLDMSRRTVESKRDKIKTKTGTKTLAGLILYAVRKGIVSTI